MDKINNIATNKIHIMDTVKCRGYVAKLLAKEFDKELKSGMIKNIEVKVDRKHNA